MSHKANNWLAGMGPEMLNNSEFRVLFHLCDCHNPSKGCFPAQGYLLDKTNVSNGTLNNALNSMEAKGIFRRILRSDSKTKKKKSTLYILACDKELFEKPSPKTGEGTVSRKQAKPSPINGQSRLQPTGDKPVKEPVKKITREGIRQEIRDAAAKIKTGKWFNCTDISDAVALEAIDAGLVTKSVCRDARLL